MSYLGCLEFSTVAFWFMTGFSLFSSEMDRPRLRWRIRRWGGVEVVDRSDDSDSSSLYSATRRGRFGFFLISDGNSQTTS
jgi:hypothetical protein